MSEFTGERVIPEQVDEDLWAEHVARYAFATLFAAGKRVLDLGCGTGYGTAELAKTAHAATGVDVAAEAVAYAAEHYPGPTFLTASAENLPFDSGSFDLITTFEMIEHLEDWRAMLAEAKRVLARTGVMIVSTPNKLYYTEARGDAGPNPYHRHEFEYLEFSDALKEYFPNVKVLLQDRMETFGFYEAGSAGKADGSIARAQGTAGDAHFFVALCSAVALRPTAAFLYVPRTVNLLRERETHISKLNGELIEVRRWLEDAIGDRDSILAQHEGLLIHLKEKNEWAARLSATLEAAKVRKIELQEQFKEEQSRAQMSIANLMDHLEEKNRWAGDLDATLKAANARIVELQEQFKEEQSRAQMSIANLMDHLEEKNRWAGDLDATLKAANARIVELQEQFKEEQSRAQASIVVLMDHLREEQSRVPEEIARLEAAEVQRTEWAQALDEKVKTLTDRIAELKRIVELVRQSRWVRAGRTLGVGPKLNEH